jgi:lactoylglutathione lyase
MFKRIDHVALHVADLDQSVAFYERHFGFRNYFQAPIPGGMQIAYLKLGDTVLELTHHSDGAMKGFHFCLETDDFDGSVAKLKADGVPVVREPHNTAPREPREEGWRRVVFGGPDGEQIELRG